VVLIANDQVRCPSVLAGPLADGEARELARAFAALGDPVRLRLLSLIASADRGETCVCDLLALVAKSQPTVSHHLKVLVEVGLVVRERRGRWSWFSVVPRRLGDLQASLGTNHRPRGELASDVRRQLVTEPRSAQTARLEPDGPPRPLAGQCQRRRR